VALCVAAGKHYIFVICKAAHAIAEAVERIGGYVPAQRRTDKFIYVDVLCSMQSALAAAVETDVMIEFTAR
jgi:hypothetical protein